jgi:hypothetical protein
MAATATRKLQYFHDGVPYSPAQNKLSSVSWWATAGDNPRARTQNGSMGSKPFRALLKRLGAEDPGKVPFKVTIPNGTVISARYMTPEQAAAATRAKKAPAKKKSAPAKKKAPAKKSAPRKAPANKAPAAPKPKGPTEREKQMKRAEERAALRAWKDGGEKGAKPATPYSDELAAKSEPSKVQQRIAADSARTPVRATNVGRNARKAGGPKKFRGPVPKPSAARKSA